MSLEVYVISGAVFFLLMAGSLAAHYRTVKQVDGTLVAAAVAFAIGIYFIVWTGVQTGRLGEAQARLEARAVAVAPGLAGGAAELAYPVGVTEGGVAVEYKHFPVTGLIAVLIGVVAMGLGVGASRRGDRSAGQTLMVLGIFLVVVAVIVFAGLR